MKDKANAARTIKPTTPPRTNEINFAEMPKFFNMLPPKDACTSPLIYGCLFLCHSTTGVYLQDHPTQICRYPGAKASALAVIKPKSPTGDPALASNQPTHPSKRFDVIDGYQVMLVW
jgi:hypothetical protein